VRCRCSLQPEVACSAEAVEAAHPRLQAQAGGPTGVLHVAKAAGARQSISSAAAYWLQQRPGLPRRWCYSTAAGGCCNTAGDAATKVKVV
jgi:hypothetical protein